MRKQREITAAIYCRLSRDDGGDAESNSIGNQRDILRRYAAEHRMILRDEYIDDGFSGTSFERPDFKRMIADIEAGKINMVLCKDLSRLGRNNAMVAYYTEMFFPDRDIRLIALNDGIDTGHGENEIMAFKSVINEYYARDISRKIRSSIRSQALKGAFCGSHAPYGYVKDPGNKHKLIIDEEAAAVVRRMFHMAVEGFGVHQIARALTNEKILIPTMYKYYQLGYKANRFDEDYPYDWRTTTIKRMLESRVYVGDIVNHKCGNKSFKNQKLVPYPESEWIIVEDMHEPIVGRDLFDRVQQLIKIKQRKNSLGMENIFLGILKCKDCGANMSHQAYQCKDGSIGGRFVCSRYRHSKGKEAGVKSCTAHYTPYANINAAVFARLRALIAANLSEDGVLRRMKARKKNAKPNQKLIEKLERRDAELDGIIRTIIEQNALRTITPVTFNKLYDGYIQEQNDIAGKLAVLHESASKETTQQDVQLFLEQIRKYSEAKELTREMLLSLVGRIEVHEPTGDRRMKNREQELVIHYRFAGQLERTQRSDGAPPQAVP